MGELVERFLHRFVSFRPTTRTSAYLLNKQQNPGESLRSYVQRFHEESVQIPDPNEQVTIAAFTHGFVAGVFNTRIHKKYPRTLKELWLKVEKGIQAEDLNRMKKELQASRSRADPQRKKETSRSEAGIANGFQSSNRDRRSVFDRIVKRKSSIPDSEFTPLNTTRSRVLSMMEQNNFGRAPPKMFGNRDKRNSNLYCLYHRDIGHETEDCNDLKKEIKHLIKQGYLKQFICRDRCQQRSGPRREDRDEKWREDRRGSRSSCGPLEDLMEAKRPPRDGSSGHGLGSHETLVIEVLANNYIIKKVYVDPGSSVDVMYLRIFEGLKLTREQLAPVRTLLVGFGGHVVHSEGIVTLTVTVGRHPRCRTIPVNFVVVKADSPYNLLMGRPTLNALRVVYSTYHLSFKFSTPVGIVEVSSDDCAARECYPAILQAALTSTSEPRSERRSNILSIDCIDSQQSRPDQTIRIGIHLSHPLRGQMVDLLREYRDVFT
nr:uncharacterized protein LOC113693195 [Coffea arabica]